MTTPIGTYDATAAAQAAQAAQPTQSASASAGQGTSGAMGPTLSGDAFLKLLVAQLKYQDPSKPVDSAQFMAQTAQLQMVETLHELVSQNAAVIAGQNSLSALALVGQRVTYSVGGVSASGTVDSVKLTAGGPTLLVNATEVPLSSVTEVARTATTTSGTASSGTSTSGTASSGTTPTGATTGSASAKD
ncbi:flagellar hook capping FlgD N-terminal domain-containing protein [Phycicoccus sp. M110.8]|uniref:flagellar hook assembly protein FlgD n=1 Tax=Phycicoccus sp. M110.8 TaxID=3075433 RepID=UPI0028FD1AC8|nr:flagellar hook capping FlgD N-terminal domain-containing protein [Phycicoccus sp. M110.8]MDU0313421.1 flagellar hook capping FlgD N-terminal domain-containing protein [Phycicoccus sp. M110.8]